MTKGLRKDFRREIRHSMSRFLSILLISALGVAFFAGIRSASPAMRKSLDTVYDNENFMDIRVMGTLGLTKDDVATLLTLNGVSGAEGIYVKDYLCPTDEQMIVAKTISMTNRINQFRVQEGRYPEKYNECLVDRAFLEASGLQLGDTIRLKTGTSEKVTDMLATDNFLIVGVGESALFLNEDHGASSLGDGTVDGMVMIPKEAYTAEFFTEALVTIQGAQELDSFSKEYKALVDDVTAQIQSIEKGRCDVRLALFKEDADEQIMDARFKFQQQQDKALTELGDAYQMLLTGEAELENAKVEIEQKKQQVSELKALFSAGDNSLPEAEKRVAAARADLTKLQKQKAEADKIIEAKEFEIVLLNQKLQEDAPHLSEEEYNQRNLEIMQKTEELKAFKAQLPAIEKSIANVQMRVETSEAFLENYPQASADAKVKIEEGEKAIAEAEKTILDNEIALERNREDYKIAREDYEAEIKTAEEQLQKKEKDILEIQTPQWYILDRTSVPSFISFKADADSVAAIGTVFPIIFFLVAALVSLTTMTRMVEEERTQIGTLKALGYNKGAIMSKYILYALFSTLFGSILGVVLGELFLPYLIIHTYQLVYTNLWAIIIEPHYFNAVVALVLALLATVGGAFGASYRVLSDDPASLMRPVAPQVGKRTFLENIDWIWQRLNFTQKAAFRNLFRYKKRLFMTILGVAGCMALLLVGFGIRDSVRAQPKKQFGEVVSYQATVGADTSLSRAERRQLLAKMSSVDGVTDYLQTRSSMIYAETEHGATTANLIVPQDTVKLADYVSLKPRLSNENLPLTDDGILITEKFAKILGVKVGDMITIKEDKTSIAVGDVRVAGIVENYINHYIYMTPNIYKALYGETATLNAALVKMNEMADPTRATEQFLDISGVTSVAMNADAEQNINEMTDNLTVIIAVMIAAAGLLAFVVLYNLNNINITERKRELATLKVLGFYDHELAAYVYRENIILTILGILCGLVLGTVLHFFVMRTIETEFVMFSIHISWLSYLISVLLTVLFSVIVNFIMFFRLRKVDMVESLKSVE